MQNSLAKKFFAVGSAVAMALSLAVPFAAHAATHAPGTNVLTSDGTVWLITAQNTRRAYTSAGAYLSYGFNSPTFAGVVPANADDLALAMDPAGYIPPQDGTIFCATATKASDVKGECSLVTGGQKASFTSEAVFKGLGFSFQYAQYGDSSFLTKTTNVDNTTAAHRPGVLINNNGTVYLVGSNGLLGIPDIQTFNSWGYSFAKVVPANAADKAMTLTGVMAMRVPSLAQLNPTGVTNPGVSPTPTPSGTVIGPISVSLASNNPGAGTVVQGQVAADLGHFVFNGTGTVTGVTLQRLGVSSNTLLKNVYLYNGAQRLTDAASVNSNGLITFNNGSNLFAVSGNMTVSVLADLICSSGTGCENDSGQTVGVQLTNVTLAGGAVASGLPISGNLMTVSSAPTLASITVSGLSPANGTSPTTNPQPGVVVWQANLSVANTSVNLTRLALREIGSINLGDINNFKLLVDGVQVAQTQSLDSNSYVTFAVSPVKMLNTGSHTVQVLADVTGGASRTFSLSLQNNADLGMTDTSYNVGVAVSGSTVPPIQAGTFTVNGVSNGSYTIQVASSSPSSNVSYNGVDVPLGDWTVSSYGEPIKITTLTVAIAASSTDAAVTLRNGRLLINGAQYGSTQSVASSTTGTQFQTNYTVQPGQPATIEFRADIYDNDGTGQLANGDTIQAKLLAGSSNAQGQTSLSVVNLPASNSSAYTVTVTTGSISLVKNGAYANQTTVAPQNGDYVLGSFYLNGSSVEPVNINSITVGFGSSTAASYLNNVKVWYNGVVEPQVKATVSATGNLWSVNHQIPVNGSVLVQVTGNVQTGATGIITTSADIAGTTASSGQTVDTTNIAGQTVTVGSGSINVQTTPDSTSPLAALLVANQSKVPVASFKFQATNDTYNITDLTFTVASTTTATQLYVYNGSTLVGQKAVGSGTVAWSGLSIPVTANTPTVLTVKVDVGAVGTGAGSPADNVKIALTSAKATGSNGVNTAVTGTTVTAYDQFVYKAVPTVSTNTTIGGIGSTLNTGSQTLYGFTVANNANGGAVTWDKVTFNVSTTSGVSIATSTLALYNSSGQQITGTFTGTYTAGQLATTFTATTEQPAGAYYLQGTVSATSLTGASVGTNIPRSSSNVAAPATAAAQTGSFVWSDQSASNHSLTTTDWNNDYLVPGIPTTPVNLTHT